MEIVLTSGRPAPPLTLSLGLKLVGILLGICAVMAIAKAAFDTHQESEHAQWPVAVATITQRSIHQYFVHRSNFSGSHYASYIECEVRYNGGGEQVTASFHSRGTQDADEKAAMRRWVTQHPAGGQLPVRYSPERPAVVVPDGGDMPESQPETADDRKMILLFLFLSFASITVGRVLQRGQQLESENNFS